jgi:hypothetical protein
LKKSDLGTGKLDQRPEKMGSQTKTTYKFSVDFGGGSVAPPKSTENYSKNKDGRTYASPIHLVHFYGV